MARHGALGRYSYEPAPIEALSYHQVESKRLLPMAWHCTSTKLNTPESAHQMHAKRPNLAQFRESLPCSASVNSAFPNFCSSVRPLFCCIEK